MNIQKVHELQESIARDMLAAAPSGWTKASGYVTTINGHSWLDFLADVPGRDAPVRYFPDEASIAAADLDRAMYERGRGTWFSMECTVEPSGEYHFTFNYDQPATFGDREPAEESWINDLRRHPRDWDNIPDWHLVKQRYTEDEWLASVQRYKDWLASDDQSPFTG
ncbi:hypothetical protein [Janibacter indicus]|uniref:Uncharacterized protein n=1 Tax=Janibacter indicus TaxID=857417 RepID=A0A1W2CF16_9MICO|nr:hypothetical protein [Janibacter indicus]SMC83492.1 hypothetical protein SAMN06296429_11120 [Janibacter indicus]